MPKKTSSISVKVATAVSLGAIIGAGIFVLSGTAIALAGTYAILAFILVGIVALMVGVQLGELGSLMPKLKGGPYSYTYKAFGSELAFITGMMLFFGYSTEISVISLGFGSYLASVLGITAPIFSIIFGIGLIAVLAIVNILGISKAAKVDSYLVLIKLCILLIFIAFGLFLAFSLNPHALSNITTGPSYGITGIFAASVVIFFAYAGFQAIASFTDKVEGGGRAAAKAIVYSVVISIVLYTAVAIVLMLMLPVGAYKISADPLAFALKSDSAPAWLSILVDIGALVATVSAALASILYSSRLLYQISEDKLLPKMIRVYDKKKDVAIDAVIITSCIAVIMLFAGNIYTIASIANVGLFISFLMVSFAIIHFRRKGESEASFKSPLYPYLPIVTIVALLCLFIGLPKEALVLGLVLIISLMIIYYSIREVEGKKPVRVVLFR